MSRRTALYRHFDVSGVLLYVGISLNSIARTMQHRHGAAWFRDIARIDIEWLPTREEALRAEREAIQREGPLNNVVHAGCRAIVAQAKPETPKAHALAVRHDRTGRLCGWFWNRSATEHLLDWFKAVFPRDRFSLLETTRGFPIERAFSLHTDDSCLWAASEPNWPAGDALDQQRERLEAMS